VSQSLSLVLIHIIFSTKDRFPCLSKSVRPHLHAYLATIVRNLKCEAYGVGGTADHVHIAARLTRTIAVADLIEKLKTSTSKWVKMQQPQLHRFSWQRGYGAFSVGYSQLKDLIQYIECQEAHHATRTFQEEYLALLNDHGVQYDERYLWD
jgi:REP element-mobilizing transposase RayT